MTFDAEWAECKAAAQAGQQAGEQPVPLRVHQPAPAGSLVAGAPSINGNANLLIEIAALLHEGRPDGDASTMARAPRAHPDVAAQALRFARFADDQFKDTVALFAGLATRLKTAGTGFARVDDDTAASFLRMVVDTGVYVKPEDKDR
ncbi:hypothetical protein AB0D29_02725 [Streptomyces sp. NPDC048424]|uniref:hypothetical protein n=1 Tax=Streptomyces sp. NPDC048424 TaxID=3155265 RepID=UPI00344A9858